MVDGSTAAGLSIELRSSSTATSSTTPATRGSRDGGGSARPVPAATNSGGTHTRTFSRIRSRCCAISTGFFLPGVLPSGRRTTTEQERSARAHDLGDELAVAVEAFLERGLVALGEVEDRALDAGFDVAGQALGAAGCGVEGDRDVAVGAGAELLDLA